MNLRRSRPRELVLIQLAEANRPVTAADISKSLSRKGIDVGLTTIYRALGTFEALGIAELFVDRVRRYGLRDVAHRHLAVCAACGISVELECPSVILSHLSRSGFKIEGHELRVVGRCRGCQGELA